MNLRDAAVLGVAQSAHQGDHVQAELALGKRESAFLLGSARLVVELAIPVHAAANNQPEAHQPRERGNGSRAMVGDPRLLAAGAAAIFERFEPQFGGCWWAGPVSCHKSISSEVAYPLAYVATRPGSRKLCRPRKKEKAKLAGESFNDMQSYYRRNSIWLSGETNELVGDFLDRYKRMINDFVIRVVTNEDRHGALVNEWGEVWKRYEKESPEIREKLEEEFRIAIGERRASRARTWRRVQDFADRLEMGSKYDKELDQPESPRNDAQNTELRRTPENGE